MSRKFTLILDTKTLMDSGEINITDEKTGDPITADMAKELSYSSQIEDSNMAFMRFCQHGFCAESLREYYRTMSQ